MSSTQATAGLLARCAFGFCGWCKPACYQRSSETFSGSSRTLWSRSSCGATAFCPAAATSCAPYTAPCYRAGSLSNCASWNAHQTPNSGVDRAGLGCTGARAQPDCVAVSTLPLSGLSSLNHRRWCWALLSSFRKVADGTPLVWWPSPLFSSGPQRNMPQPSCGMLR